MTNTQLSDMLEKYAYSQSRSDYSDLCQLFISSAVGVIAVGASEGQSGLIISTADNPIQLGLTKHGDGKPRVLAFADPAAFVQKFGQKFNAYTKGIELCKTARFNDECEGILLNSAKSEISVIIDRSTILSLLGENEDTRSSRIDKKPWWKFW